MEQRIGQKWPVLRELWNDAFQNVDAGEGGQRYCDVLKRFAVQTAAIGERQYEMLFRPLGFMSWRIVQKCMSRRLEERDLSAELLSGEAAEVAKLMALYHGPDWQHRVYYIAQDAAAVHPHANVDPETREVIGAVFPFFMPKGPLRQIVEDPRLIPYILGKAEKGDLPDMNGQAPLRLVGYAHVFTAQDVTGGRTAPIAVIPSHSGMADERVDEIGRGLVRTLEAAGATIYGRSADGDLWLYNHLCREAEAAFLAVRAHVLDLPV